MTRSATWRRSAKRRKHRPLAVVAAFAFAAIASLAHAAVYPATPADYRQSLKRLKPGDTLLLAAGEYRGGLFLHDMSGAPGEPIVISGPEHGEPATFFASAGRNTVSLSNARYLVIKNIVLEGGNLPVDALKAEGRSAWAHDITLENLVIRGHGNNQQTVGISTKCPAWNWVVRGSTIIGAGTGMYFGDSNGTAPFVAGLIERNVIVDSIGYNLQVKHQLARPELPGMPAGRSSTVIRHNVFAKPNAGSPEEARPNVLVGHFPKEGRGAEDDYAIYGNFFYQNRYEALFQGEGNVALYSNVFVNDYGDGVRIQPHNDVPRRIAIAYNTIVARGTGITVTLGQGTPPYVQEVSGNAVFAAMPVTAPNAFRNLGAPLADASSYLRSPFAPPPELDLRPKRSLASAVSGKAIARQPWPDWGRDFDGESRASSTIGAYGRAAGAPGWTLQFDRKTTGGPAKRDAGR